MISRLSRHDSWHDNTLDERLPITATNDATDLHSFLTTTTFRFLLFLFLLLPSSERASEFLCVVHAHFQSLLLLAFFGFPYQCAYFGPLQYLLSITMRKTVPFSRSLTTQKE